MSTNAIAIWRAAKAVRREARVDRRRQRMDAGLLSHAAQVGGTRASMTAGHVAMHRASGTAKRPRKVLPRQGHADHVIRDYARAIKALAVAPLRAAIASVLLPRLPQLVESAARARAVHHDSVDRLDAPADEGEQVQLLMDLVDKQVKEKVTTRAAGSLAERYGQQVSDFQRTQLQRQLKAALGVNPILHEGALQPIMGAFVNANVGYIQDIPDQAARQIEERVLRGIQLGHRHEDIAEDIQQRLQVASGRAELIARDQVGKIQGQVNAARQRSLGITRFVWRSVEDERVRPEHQEYDGNTYDYDDPPSGELPGEAVNCRCSAEPNTDDILAMLDDDEPDDAETDNDAADTGSDAED